MDEHVSPHTALYLLLESHMDANTFGRIWPQVWALVRREADEAVETSRAFANPETRARLADVRKALES